MVIFSSRWLQLPLYLGLIVAQGVYVVLFLKELWHLVHGATSLSEQDIMLLVLGLIDVVMISNLLMMVIVGGYETFVSRMGLQKHPDQPEWLSHVNASMLKSEARHGDHRHLLHPLAEDLHRGRQYRRADGDELHHHGRAAADADPHHLHLFRAGHRLGRPDDAGAPAKGIEGHSPASATMSPRRRGGRPKDGPPAGVPGSTDILDGIVDQQQRFGRLAHCLLDVAIEGGIRLSRADRCRIVEVVDMACEAQPLRKVAGTQVLLIARQCDGQATAAQRRDILQQGLFQPRVVHEPVLEKSLAAHSRSDLGQDWRQCLL
jgi:hypothetical protein